MFDDLILRLMGHAPLTLDLCLTILWQETPFEILDELLKTKLLVLPEGETCDFFEPIEDSVVGALILLDKV